MKRLLLLLLLSPLAALAGCQTNPRTGRTQLLIYSEDQMNELGRAAYQEMTGPNGKAMVERDARLISPLLRVGAAIQAAADKPDYEWEFKLIRDDETVNAWALPGGKIAFYTGIYPILRDEAGMAVVMGHEVMHAVLQHGNERMSQGMLANLAVAAAAVGFHDHKHRDEIIAALGAGMVVGVMLPYSRSHESEADRYGLYLAARAGYDPEAAIGVWQRMAELSRGKRPPELLSTHPDPESRIEAMRAYMPEAKRIYEQSVKQPNRPLPPIR